MFKTIRTLAWAAGATAWLFAMCSPASAQSLQKRHFKAVGSWGNLSQYQTYEAPFWTKVLSEKSEGAITGEIAPITELGLKGFEVLRLMKLGVFDVAFGVFGYVASEQPVFEGVDLSAAAKDFAESRANANVYRAILSREFERIFNAKLLVIYRYPSQYLWCNKEVRGLKDLKGLKIRVYSTTLGDFVESVGGAGVTVAFAEVVPALQKGVVDCGITGTMPAYQAKWYEVATHVLKINVGTGMAFMAMNLKTWNSLNKPTQEFLLKESADLENRMWQGTEEEDQIGLRCITSGPCPIGEVGRMKLVEPGAEDFATRERILREFVIKRWADRCGAKCAAEWNETIGKTIGIKAGA